MKDNLNFDIYGVTVGVASSDGEILDEIRRDFEWFLVPAAGSPPDVRIELCAEPVPHRKSPASPGSYEASDEGDVRSLDYQGRASTVYDFKAERGKVTCPERDLLHELSYLLVLSRVGERLDRKGYHRVHGLGFGYHGHTGLILLPVGGGKTTLVLEMMKDPAFRLFS